MMGEQKFSKRKVANFLRDSAKTLEKYGWVQGRGGDVDHGFCAIGAMCHTVTRSGPCLDFLGLNAMNRYLASKSFGRTVHYNDAPGRTKAEVLKTFRDAAAWLEHGGSFQ